MVLCKDGDGKVGLRVKAIDKGIFVALVAKGSPASMGGLKFGDQILQINNVTVAGFTAEKVHNMFKSCGVNNIVLAVRDRYVKNSRNLSLKILKTSNCLRITKNVAFEFFVLKGFNQFY